jgi:UDP:flavonoid glycosyltransferase YjiC (YdhE family)
MPRILLAHDLGDGLGHVAQLLPLARALRARGAEPLLALRDPATAWPRLAGAGLPLVQAPYARPVNDINAAGQRVASFAELLAIHGWHDRARLAALVAAWQGLLDLHRPGLVVADYAPVLGLAAWRQVPVVRVGSGYTTPPAEGPRLPRLRELPDWVPEAELLAAAAAVQAERGRPAPATLTEVLRGAASFVTHLPLLDPYAAHRAEPAAGPLEPLPAPAEGPPEVDYFAYLAADHRGTAIVLGALARSGLAGSVYLRGAGAALRARWRAAGLALHEAPQPLAAAVARAALVLHHGGIGTCQDALALGRPQLLVPRHLEQGLNAAALARLGVAVTMRTGARFAAEHVLAALAHLRRPRFAEAARAEAGRLAATPLGSLARIVERCLSLAGGGP